MLLRHRLPDAFHMLNRALTLAALAALPLATLLCGSILLLWPATPLWLLALLMLLLPMWSAMVLYGCGLASTLRCTQRLFGAKLLLWSVALTAYGLLAPSGLVLHI